MTGVKVVDSLGRRVAHVDILGASGLSDELIGRQRQLGEEQAKAMGARFYLLVTGDEVIGWRVDEKHPLLRLPREATLAPYAGSAKKAREAHDVYLASLVQAWLSDVASGWRTKHGEPPGAKQLGLLGLLRELRTGLLTESISMT